jgi:hypothetical protein
MMKRIMAVFSLAVAVSLSVAASPSNKTLTCGEDPVVIEGRMLSSMAGKPISSLSLMRFGKGGFKAIPFQVDERTEAGEFVYTDGPKANPGEGDGNLSARDELVFMAWDSGARATVPKPEGAEAGVEIMIQDSAHGGRAWVYLFSFSSSPPRSDVDYVKHTSDEERNWVETERYRFAEPKGETYFDRLLLKRADGKMSHNLADRVKGRGNLKAARGLVELNMGESGTKGDLMAWIDGPVRVVHLMQAYMDIKIAKIKAGGGSNNLFYENYFVTPIFFDLPITPSTLLSDFKMIYGIDFNKNIEGMRYFDPVNPEGVIMDGRMDEAEKDMDRDTAHDWWAVTGDQGNLLIRMILPEEWKNIVLLKTRYIDDDNSSDPPESVPGQRQPGFILDGMYSITKGLHIFYRYYYVPDTPLDMEEVKPYLDMLDNPFKVEVSPFAP